MMDLLLATSGGEAQAASGGYVDDVFSAYTYTGNASTQTINNGIDLAGNGGLVWIKSRSGGVPTSSHILQDTARGANKQLRTNTTDAEGADNVGWAFNANGFSMNTSISYLNDATPTYYASWTFRRAPKFFDVVCYTGTGSATTVSHNLGVAPELMIVKARSGDAQPWVIYHKDIGNGNYLKFDTTTPLSSASLWNNTTPTSTSFTVGGGVAVNSPVGRTYVAYIFATLPGISKVGSYTGNGTSQTINCGFATGARFILVKRTDATGDWYVWDSVRGIIAANDPHLSLNTTAAEVTTDDSVDPEVSGFIVNQNTATNINVTGGQYIFLAIA